MCGDIEGETPLEQRIIENFRGVAGHYMAAAERGAGGDAAHGYMDRLLADLLRRCLADLDADDASLERLQAQGVVLARLAGILAGQLPPAADGLHPVMDALLVGYGEAQGDAGHGHENGHDRHHGHHH